MMDISIVEKTGDKMEIEFQNKEAGICLVSELLDAEVDAYGYTPHPLIPGYRVCVESENHEKDVKKAIKNMKKNWKDLEQQIMDKL